MALSEKTTRAIVTALNQQFDGGEVASILQALDVFQSTSPPLMAASPNFNFYMPGIYYDASFMGTLNSPTYLGVANALDLLPFFVTRDLNVTEFTVGVTTGVAATNARVVIYEANDNSVPGRKVYESVDLSTATSTTAPAIAASFTFLANKLYWIGTHCSGAPNLRGVRDYAVMPLGFSTGGVLVTGNLMLRRSVTYGSAPAAYNFTTADLATATPPSVRFKVA